MVTECSMSDNVAVEYPDVEFVRPCNLCPHMKRITLDEDPALAADDDDRSPRRSRRFRVRAKRAIDRMLAVKLPAKA